MSNHIDHIEIKNFKSIQHQTIEGCKRINVFIGYPNVGKSVILEAISALGYLQKDFNEPFEKICRIKSARELFYNGDISNDIWLQYSENKMMRFIYNNENSFTLSFGFVKFTLDNISHDWSAFYHKQFYLNDNSFISTGQSYDGVDKDILSVKKYHFKNSYNEFATNGLVLFSPYGENLVDIIQSNKELRKEVIELFKSYDLKLNIDQRNNSIYGYKQLEEGIVYTIPFYQMADTLQRLIFHKAAIMSNKNTVLLFEEPESHMFPPYISILTSDIIFDKNNNQYFIATHSPFVLNDLLENLKNDELSIYAVGLHNGATTIKRITDEEMSEIYQYGIDLFFNLENYLKDV